jgi:hypothetical protein
MEVVSIPSDLGGDSSSKASDPSPLYTYSTMLLFLLFLLPSFYPIVYVSHCPPISNPSSISKPFLISNIRAISQLGLYERPESSVILIQWFW